ncbi:phytoene desaturase family protein [Occultella aeris]|uniref:Zeta-carotene-forming phytoene desaturase n=1 Tax=Occultella aeris TaxID=2761496 RepID=A0A7M4DF08_9MICO|nr:phytoene desaturase family protein [Occultella aeris]VZO35501.1 zeta-carotene-forming phytoene desaturase [Occultella aeris]
MTRRVAIVGGGISGLATAALLAADGHEVELFEARDDLGGRAGSWSAGGFRFDTGPSWYLMPEVFEHFYRLLGTSAQEQLDLIRLDPGYRVFFESGAAPFDVSADREQVLATFERLEVGARARMERYLASARETYRLALDHFLYDDFASPRSLVAAPVLRRAPRLARLLLQPLDAFAARAVTDPRLRQVLGYPAVFLGTSPYRAPSLYHLMSHLDLEDGVYYPRGGFTTLIDGIAHLARARGAVLHTGATVTRITVEDGAATGVEYTDGEGMIKHARTDIVVSTADLYHTEQSLLEPTQRSRSAVSWRRTDPGPSAVLVMLGVRGTLPRLTHHNLLFTSDWQANFAAIEEGRVPDPASVYVCKPSETDPSVAPPGHENLFVLVPLPADVLIGAGGTDGAGDERVEAIADAAIARIADWSGEHDLAERVVVRRTVGPADFANDLNSWRGSALGPAHVLRQSAFLRGRVDSARVRDVYHAGATTLPGIGLPMCLISAELVAKRVRGVRGGGRLPEPARASGPTDPRTRSGAG